MRKPTKGGGGGVSVEFNSKKNAKRILRRSPCLTRRKSVQA